MRTKLTLLLVAAVLAPAAGTAAPASAAPMKRCPGISKTPVVNLDVVRTTCGIGRTVAGDFLRHSNTRPRDALGRVWRCRLTEQGDEVNLTSRVRCTRAASVVRLNVGYLYEFG